MAQFHRPNSTISTGAWNLTGAATIHEALGTVTVDTDSYINTNAGGVTTCRVGMSNPAATPGEGTVTFRAAVSRLATNRAVTIEVRLYQGESLLHTITEVNSPTAHPTVTNLSEEVTASITDWNNLEVEVAVTSAHAQGVGYAYWVELEAPDGGAPEPADVNNIDIGTTLDGAQSDVQPSDTNINLSIDSAESSIDTNDIGIASQLDEPGSDVQLDDIAVGLDIDEADAGEEPADVNDISIDLSISVMIPTPHFIIKSDNTKVSEAVTNLYFDLSLAPPDFWSQVKSDGGDIRVYRVDTGEEVAREISAFDKANQKGSLFISTPNLSTSEATEYAIHFGNESLEEPAPGSTYGKYNVWDSSIYANVYHLDEQGSGANNEHPDATGNVHLKSGAVTNSPGIPALVDGKIGNGLEFDGVDDSVGGSFSGAGLTEFAISVWAKLIAASQSGGSSMAGKANTDQDTVYGAGGIRMHGIQKIRTEFVISTTGHWQFNDNEAPINEHSYIVFRWKSGVTREEASNKNWISTTAATGTTRTPNLINIGVVGAAGDNRRFEGVISEVRFLKTVQSRDWFDTEYNNQNDNAAFWDVGEIVAEPPPGVDVDSIDFGATIDGAGSQVAPNDADINLSIDRADSNIDAHDIDIAAQLDEAGSEVQPGGINVNTELDKSEAVVTPDGTLIGLNIDEVEAGEEPADVNEINIGLSIDEPESNVQPGDVDIDTNIDKADSIVSVDNIDIDTFIDETKSEIDANDLSIDTELDRSAVVVTPDGTVIGLNIDEVEAEEEGADIDDMTIGLSLDKTQSVIDTEDVNISTEIDKAGSTVSADDIEIGSLIDEAKSEVGTHDISVNTELDKSEAVVTPDGTLIGLDIDEVEAGAADVNDITIGVSVDETAPIVQPGGVLVELSIEEGGDPGLVVPYVKIEESLKFRFTIKEDLKFRFTTKEDLKFRETIKETL